MTPRFGLSVVSASPPVDVPIMRKQLTSISALMVLEKQPDQPRRGCRATTCSITSLCTRCGWKPMLSAGRGASAGCPCGALMIYAVDALCVRRAERQRFTYQTR